MDQQGGLLMGAVVNQAPEIIFGNYYGSAICRLFNKLTLIILLPLTVGEFDEFGNAKDIKEHFELYIFIRTL